MDIVKIKKRLADHLKCMEEKGLQGGGTYKCRWGIYEKAHILKLNKENKTEKYKTVCEWIKALGVSCDDFQKEKMHRFAHHLNSSQVLCYSFFKDLKDNGKLSEFVKRVLDIDAKDLDCEFEYEPQANSDKYKSHQATNYDCRIFNDTFELLIEVKYTEGEFGTCVKDESHRYKFENCYRRLISGCKVLSKERINSLDVMSPYYQLIRNVLQIRDEKTYCLFLYPKANTSVDNKYNKFYEDGPVNKEEYDKYVKRVYWEELLDLMSKDIRDVYFDEEIFPKIENSH